MSRTSEIVAGIGAVCTLFYVVANEPALLIVALVCWMPLVWEGLTR